MLKVGDMLFAHLMFADDQFMVLARFVTSTNVNPEDLNGILLSAGGVF